MVNEENNTKIEEKASLPIPDAADTDTSTKKPRRTPGLWAVDFLLYPVLTNGVVFTASVLATYLTNKGNMRNVEGKPLYGKVGQAFHKRSEMVVDFFKNRGMSEKKAEMWKMVAFSFGDGTLLAPITKLAEDRREKIAKWIDDKLGTKPADEVAAYRAEPKQSWFSVITGRLAVASIIVPTALLLSREGKSGKSLNDIFLNDPGKKFGRWLAKKPSIANLLKGWDIEELGRVGVFEAFYTSVCTAGLYVTSRFLARNTSKKKTGEMKSILDGNGNGFKHETVVSDATDRPVKTTTSSSLEQYQKKTILPPAETYAADLAKTRETDYSLSP